MNIRVDEYTVVGVLETPCYPNSFYAGIIRFGPDGWFPADNETSLYHKTKEEAESAVLELAEHLQALKGSKMNPVLLFVEWVCGPNYKHLTYGERDAKIIQKAKEMGWDLSHLGPDGWCLAKDNHHVLCNTIGEAIEKLINSLPRACCLEPITC